jgi:hypothetical protein
MEEIFCVFTAVSNDVTAYVSNFSDGLDTGGLLRPVLCDTLPEREALGYQKPRQLALCRGC